MTNATIKDIVRRRGAWRPAAAGLLTATAPLSFNLARWTGTKGGRFLSPADLLGPLLGLLLLLAWLRGREQRRSRPTWPPVPAWLFGGWALLSCLWTADFSLGEIWKPWVFRALAGYVFFPLALVWVFMNLPAWVTANRRDGASGDNPEKERTERAAVLRGLALVLGGSVGVCFFWALYQYFGPVGRSLAPGEPSSAAGGVSAVRLGGWYAYRGIFGAQAAMTIPACAAFALRDRSSAVRAAAGFLAVVGLTATLSGGAFAAALAGIIAVAAVCSLDRRLRPRAVALPLLLAAGMYLAPTILPRNNAAVLERSLASFSAGGANGNRLYEKEAPTARLRRGQAVRNLLSRDGNLAHGVGAGQLQNALAGGTDYRPPYSKPGGDTDDEALYDLGADEPFSFPLARTVAGELGLPGLLLLLWLLLHWIFAAAKAADDSGKEKIPGHENTLATAALGAGVGAVVLIFFGNPWVRGCGGTFAFFAAVAWLTATPAPAAPEAAAPSDKGAKTDE